jgi:serine/threonine-protein phosphatase 2A regulatory subunit B
VEFSDDGELLATGDKGGRIVIFQREPTSKHQANRAEYNVYSTFQSHEAEFDYLKSLEIEEKINKIKWLRRKNAAHFLLSTNDKTVKLWKIRERSKRAETAASLRDGGFINGSSFLRPISVPVVKDMDRIEVEAIPKRIFSNAHTYHINSISLNSDQETFMSSDDLRINLWHIEITNQSFSKLLGLTELLGSREMSLGCIFSTPNMTIKPIFFTPRNRYCRHKTGEHGGTDRSYYGCRVPSERVQSLRL